MKTFRIWNTSKPWDYEDYEAGTAREAIERYQKETGHFYYWDLRIIK